MRRLHRSNVEQEARERLIEEKKRMAMPRFETPQEQEARLQREKERAEFGNVSVAFRLSTPNAKYTYYTDMPEEFYSKDREEDDGTALDELTLQAIYMDTEPEHLRSEVSVHTRSKSCDPNSRTSIFPGCQSSVTKFKPKGTTFITETEFASLGGRSLKTHCLQRPVASLPGATLEESEQKRRLSSYKQLSPLISRSNRRHSSTCAKRNNGSKHSYHKKSAQHMETIHMRLSESGEQHCHYTAGIAEAKSRLVISCSAQS